MKILLIYTGGTIGMKLDPKSGSLTPFDFSQVIEEVPELTKFGCRIDSISFKNPKDSSEADLDFWLELSKIIYENYDKYNGFVVLHGTDTMSYTASAISFMLEDLEKPVIFTGSQLPIGMLRTDGKENLISSIEIASATDIDGHAIVPEVCIYFQNELFRANRSTKYNAENFQAFKSPNYPLLAEAGVHLIYHKNNIRQIKDWGKKLVINSNLDPSVAIMKIYPGMNYKILESIVKTKGVRAIILETYGSGNAPTSKEFLNIIIDAVKKGIIFYNVTQCIAGSVDMKAYSTGRTLDAAGVIGGVDITIESALTKLYYLLGNFNNQQTIIENLKKNLRGEMVDNWK